MAAISVTVYEPRVPVSTTDGGSRAASGEGAWCITHIVGRPDKISSEVLRANLADFLDNFGQALSGIPVAQAGYDVEQIELSLDISATGAVSLVIGNPSSLDKAALKLTLKRR